MNGENLQLKKRLPRSRQLIVLLTLLLFICNSLPSFAFQPKAQVTLKANNISIGRVLAEIKKQTGLIAFYSNKVLNDQEKVSVDFRHTDVEEVMKSVLKGKSLQFEVNDKFILIKTLNETNSSLNASELSQGKLNQDITGKVIDEKGAPLPGVNVVVMGTNLATQTDGDGQFSLQNVKENAILTFSFLGYRSLQLPAKAKMKVKLEPTELNLKEVVYTGMGINRDAKTFTGATATFTGDQLKTIGNINLIQSLKSLDPAFIVVENNLKGSDPNSTPIIEIRGKTGAAGLSLNDQFGSDPNQPLFILDGFETTLQRIIDLDMNRIQSVVILKDAASTALYGSKASNGVVVVETVKPKEGKLRFSYTSDFRVEAPDLTVYNLMNSTEKLQFEKLAGRYTANTSEDQIGLDQSYSAHLTAVQQGVNTYWLNEPVQIGYTKNNSVSVSGGDQNLQYGVGFNYKLQDGVMKGSDRNGWGGNMNLVYRKSKLSIANNFSVNGTSNANSPYGSFSTWAQQNPYYKKDPDAKWLEQTSAPALNSTFILPLNVPNPLYNALLGSFNNGKSLDLTNSTNVKIELLPELRLDGGFQIAKSEGSTTVFTSPDNTMYENTDFTLKGKYINGKSEGFSYTGNALLTFGKVLGKHSITANARTELSHRFNSSLGNTYVGFPTGSNGNPRFAFGYDDNGKPSASQSVYRTANALVSANYSYNGRYLFDGSYRLDGSTSYGTNNRMTPYYAGGIGWNLANEKFIKGISWINNLKLSSNIGVTGNQNFGSVAASSVYTFNPSFNKFGQALNLTTVANPDIKAQKTLQLSNSFNFSLFNNKLGGYFQFYNKFTDNLVVSVSNASATGFTSHQENLGNLTTKGFEMRLTYNVIQNLKSRINWTISATASHTQSAYGGLGNKLSRLNATQEASKTYKRFQDGYSPSAIWAAKSLGIDPATGREMFLTPTGDYTFEYNYADIQRIGNTDPFIQGVITNAIRIKRFNVNMSMRYSQGADIINTALFNKVENISYAQLSLNQDVRALYERWQKPGDIAQFKGISLTDATQMSSRFVQRENVFSFESISVGYNFENAKWMKNMGMNGLNFSAYTNDIFRISTVKNERGIDYPFARSVSFSLRASF
ncbi:SusC/RagA family TonB-linked outer membrane protein [Solitalea sp. MAHUQ-68]|uniref:SusC/RagA family TonB-linked outer membrane protein n=1 Tax=Solitalea agri TaxID=2953739 RepID=A0A9X2JF35_9SPHI|nr:SusC/RagA family TonB-linked outer membrane protein [Solitalea agri]MCO4294565.1 SusC/RagA family TonB-linked outer membrane protein [Solitalea agri]